jgi:hypothetical protein
MTHPAISIRIVMSAQDSLMNISMTVLTFFTDIPETPLFLFLMTIKAGNGRM